jgi:hypothetical protein
VMVRVVVLSVAGAVGLLSATASIAVS